MTTFGDWLSHQLERHQMQQRDLAGAASVSPQFVNDCIRSRRLPSRDTVVRIASVLRVDANWPCYLAGHIPPALDNMHPDDLSACVAMLNLRRKIWPRAEARS